MARERQGPPFELHPQDPFLLMGPGRRGSFPPGENSATPVTDIEADETPDGYGFSLDQDGRIAKGTVPTGTARIAKTSSIIIPGDSPTATTMNWYYNRLWYIDPANTAVLNYGAPNHNEEYFRQGLGKEVFAQDASPILVFIPVSRNQMFVAKATGSYIIENIDDRGVFFRSDIAQEMFAPAANQVTELDGVIYVSNVNGLFSFAEGKVNEITRKVRNNATSLARYANQALTVDYTKKRIIGTTFAYDVENEKLFRYSGSTFRATSKQFHQPDYSPFTVGRLVFVIEHSTTANGTLKYQIKFEDDNWGQETTVILQSKNENFTVVLEDLAQSRAVSRFQIRITSLTSTKYIREVRLSAVDSNFDDYRQ